MSRLSIWLSVVLVSALAAAGVSACPGTFAIGLPLLFGSEEPTCPWPASTDFRPILDWQLPAGFDEAQDSGAPLGRKGLAQECLKVWQQLVREGRFDLAPVVAAKAASLDPTNIDVQQAVIVSQVLRNIDEKTRQYANRVDAGMATKIRVAPVHTATGCEANVCDHSVNLVVGGGAARQLSCLPTFSEAVLPKLQQVQTMWEHSLVVKDNVQGLAGRVYLFADDKPHVGNGSLTVFAHEVLSDNKTRPFEAWEIDRLTLQELGCRDRIGWGYTVFLPFAKQRPEINRVQLQVKFTPDNGTPLTSLPITVSLSERNEANVTSGLTPAGRLTPDLNVSIKIPSLLETTAAPPTENEIVAQRALKHLFPGGILATAPSCDSVCPAASKPVADSIPARRVPENYLAPSKNELKLIPMTALGQPKPTNYRLAAGDVLGIHLDGVLGEAGQNPFMQKSDDPDYPPWVGYPIPVCADGTISLPPLSKSLDVAGKTLGEAEALIARAYTTPKMIVDLNNARLLVSLIHPRRYAVQVLRQDAPALAQGANSARRQSIGLTLNLTAYKNDVLNALTQTGGLPTLDALNEISVQRRLKDGSIKNTRIPLRIRAGDPVPFQPSDVILEDGDVVFIERRETEVYYIEGLPVAREFTLPRDRDLRVTDAIFVAKAPFINGGVSQNNIDDIFAQQKAFKDRYVSTGNISVIRRTKNNGQIKIQVDLALAMNDHRENIIIQGGDTIVMPETNEAKQPLEPSSLTAATCDSATPQCGSVVAGFGLNSNAGNHVHIRTVGHTAPAAAHNRVTIKTAAWLVECDRVVLMNDREMLVEGNVNLLMRQRDMSVHGSRVRVNLTDGSIQVDGK